MAHAAAPSRLLLGPCNSLVLRQQLPPAAPACRLGSCRQRYLSVRLQCKPTEVLAVTEAEQEHVQAGLPPSSTGAVWSTEQHPAPAQASQGHAAPQQQPVQGISTAGAAQDPAVRARLWKAAIKLPMYSVGYIPVLVGGALVFYQLGVAPMAQLAGYVLASLMIIAWLNLSNDAFDAHTGVDQSKPESVVNLTGNHTLVAALAVAFFVAGTGLLAALLGGSGDVRPAALLAFSIVCGYVYQGPPFRLSYKGLGEPLCFMAFGPSATTAFYLAMSQLAAPAAATAAPTAAAASLPSPLASVVCGVPASVWWCSVLVGLTTTIILFTSHFHPIEGDRAAGKLSPLVRLGPARGLKVLQASVASAYVLAAAAVLLGSLPVAVLPVLCCSLPAARELLAYAVQHHLVPARIAILKRFTCFWHIAFGCSLTAGLMVPRLLPALML